MRFFKNRNFYEIGFVVITTLLFSLGIAVLGSIQPKFQIALILGMTGMIFLALAPQKRTLCLVLLVMMLPLSIEKILYTGAPLWEHLRGQEIVVNMADIILIMLAIILVIEKITLGKPLLVWNRKATLFFLLIVWGVFSYLIHLNYYQDGIVNLSQIGILHLFRNLAFLVVITSAIQSKADLIWVLVAVMFMVLLESFIVGLSFATGEAYSFLRLLGATPESTTYIGEAGAVYRASGTMGSPNQQALFHSVFTFLLIGLFAVKNVIFRHIALIALLSSFMAVIFTFSRSAWLCMALASTLICIIFIKRREIKPSGWLIGSLLLIGFATFLAIFAQPIFDRITKGDNGATDSRVRMILLAKDLFLHNPIIGVGPSEYTEAGLKLYPPGYKDVEWVAFGEAAIVPPLGRVELAQGRVDPSNLIIVPLSVHNKYFLTLSELGIVGLIIWLLIFYEFFKDAKSCALSKDKFFRFVGVGGLGIVLVACVYMNLDLFADDKTLQILLFPLVIIGAAANLNRLRNV